jgi:transcriptional regulator with XRE-family HTH domain
MTDRQRRQLVSIAPSLSCVGARVRAIRERLGMTQAHLAERLQIASNRVGHYEIGRRPLPVEVAIRLAKLSKTTLDHIYTGHPWVRVVFAAEVADDGLCPVCQDLEFSACPCPGPTMHELYEYQEHDGELMARLKPEAERG